MIAPSSTKATATSSDAAARMPTRQLPARRSRRATRALRGCRWRRPARRGRARRRRPEPRSRCRRRGARRPTRRCWCGSRRRLSVRPAHSESGATRIQSSERPATCCCTAARCSATRDAPSSSASVRASSGRSESVTAHTSGSSAEYTKTSRRPVRCTSTPRRSPSSVVKSYRTPIPGQLGLVDVGHGALLPLDLPRPYRTRLARWPLRPLDPGSRASDRIAGRRSARRSRVSLVRNG